MSEVPIELKITEVGSLKTARNILRHEFRRMGDDMLVRQNGTEGLNLVPGKFMQNLTTDVFTIVKFVSGKDESVQNLLQKIFDNDFTLLHLYMLINSSTNAFSPDQLLTIRRTAQKMTREFPYFANSSNELLRAVSSYAEKFDIELPEE